MMNEHFEKTLQKYLSIFDNNLIIKKVTGDIGNFSNNVQKLFENAEKSNYRLIEKSIGNYNYKSDFLDERENIIFQGVFIFEKMIINSNKEKK